MKNTRSQSMKRGKLEWEIRQKIIDGIFSLRLPPGARLTEDTLADTFKVSRTVIRLVMARLTQEGILVKKATGATCVASPTKEEISQILQLRRIIEPEVVIQLAKNHEKLSFTSLLEHLERERAVREKGDLGSLVRLTGEFHLLLIQTFQNHFLEKMMLQLQVLVCLGVMMYGDPEKTCGDAEHRDIVDAIMKGDWKQANLLMIHHLDHIEEMILSKSHRHIALSDALSWLAK